MKEKKKDYALGSDTSAPAVEFAHDLLIVYLIVKSIREEKMTGSCYVTDN